MFFVDNYFSNVNIIFKNNFSYWVFFKPQVGFSRFLKVLDLVALNNWYGWNLTFQIILVGGNGLFTHREGSIHYNIRSF